MHKEKKFPLYYNQCLIEYQSSHPLQPRDSVGPNILESYVYFQGVRPHYHVFSSHEFLGTSNNIAEFS